MSGKDGRPASSHQRTFAVFAVAAIIIAYALFSLLTLDRNPMVWVDEPWLAQPAASFAQHGGFGSPMLGSTYGLDEDNVVVGRLYLLPMAAVFKVAGIGPWQARLPSYVAGLVALFLLYRVGARLYDRRVAFAAVALLGFSYAFYRQSHDARQEMMLAAFILGAWLLLLIAEERRSRVLYALAGLVAALSIDIHMNGVILSVALWFVLMQRSGWRSLYRMPGVSLVLGGVAGVAWWLGVHVAVNPRLFFLQWNSMWAGQDRGFGPMREPLQALVAELQRYTMITGTNPATTIFTLAFVISVLFVFARGRTRSDNSILVFSAVWMTGLLLLVANKTYYYLILLLPLQMLLISAVAMRAEPIQWLRRTLRTAYVLLLAATVVMTAAFIAYFWSADYWSYIAEVKRYVPDGAIVQADATYWYGLQDHPFFAHQAFDTAPDYSAALHESRIEYLVADEFYLNDGMGAAWPEAKRREALAVLERATLVAEVRDRYYGRGVARKSEYVTKIYRLPEQED